MNSLFCVFNKTVFICFKFFRIRKGQVQSFFVVSFFRVINICVIVVVVVVVDVGVFVIIVEYPRIKVFKTITRDCYCIIVQFETKVQICFLVIYIYTNIGCYISIYIYMMVRYVFCCWEFKRNGRWVFRLLFWLILLIFVLLNRLCKVVKKSYCTESRFYCHVESTKMDEYSERAKFDLCMGLIWTVHCTAHIKWPLKSQHSTLIISRSLYVLT